MRKFIRYIPILFLVTSSLTNIAQDFFVGGGPTLSTYFGDLSPFSTKLSWSQINPGLGLYASKKIIGPLFFTLNLEKTTLSGEDARSNTESRRLRNLSFKAPVQALSPSLNFRAGILKNNNLGVSGGIGLTLFHFNPQAKLNGVWYHLKNYSTEGQGLEGGIEPYKLIQWANLVQAGLFIKLAKSWYLDIIITQYFTRTDYLDDVSKNYFDPVKLVQAKGQLAYQLAYRTKEVDPSALEVTSGFIRGNPNKKDHFVIFKFGISRIIDGGKNSISGTKVKCPVF